MDRLPGGRSRCAGVLISNKVNIWREIAAANAGIVEADTPGGASAQLSSWLNMSAPERERMAQAGFACYKKHFHVDAATDRLLTTITAEQW